MVMGTTRKYTLYWHDNREHPDWTRKFKGYESASWTADVRAANVKDAERLAKWGVWRTKRGEEGLTRIRTNHGSRHWEITGEEDYALKLPDLMRPSDYRRLRDDGNRQARRDEAQRRLRKEHPDLIASIRRFSDIEERRFTKHPETGEWISEKV
jgi:hypothetical protein